MTDTMTLIAELERVPLGEPWSLALAAAEYALAADRAAAESALFPSELMPVSTDTINAYAWHTARLAPAGYPDGMVDLHRRCLVKHPELAAMLRSADAIADVGAAAAGQATPSGHESYAAAGARAAAESIARYKLEVARQIADAPGHELGTAACALLSREDLGKRIATVKARHQEHARENLAQLAEERRATERAVVDQTAQRVREAAARDAAARAAVEQTQRDYRRSMADELAARLRASGLERLRVGTEGGLYEVNDLIAGAPQMSVEQIRRYNSALDAHGGAR